MYTYWRFERTPINVDGDWNEADMEVIEGFRMPNLMTKTKDGKDSFSLKIDNFNGEYDNYFQERDRLKIFVIKNNTTGFTSSDLLMDGSIASIKYDNTSNGSMISIDGYNFTEALFGALVFVDSEGLTIDMALKTAVDQIGGLSKIYKLEWASSNPTTKSTGGAFPLTGKRYYYVTFNKMMEELSASTKTGDGNYTWFVDNDNVVHWEKVGGSAIDYFDVNTDIYHQFKIGRDASKVKNFIIVKGGYDAKDKPIQDRFINFPSVAKNGYKFHFLIDDTRLSENLEEVDAASKGESRMKDYTFGTISPPWAGGATYTNFDDYNAALRLHVKLKLKEIGQGYASLYEFGEYQVSIDFKPLEKNWTLGDAISCNIPQLESVPITMTVEEIQYTNNMFTYTLIKDEE